MAIQMPEGACAGQSLRTFFLLGAPRCGTTFLSKMLARHPEVCFSKPKETHFFTRQRPGRPIEEVRRAFLKRYFLHLDPAHRILGEGSPTHLYAPEVIQRLLALDPVTRFLVAVRNPLEMAPSYHGRLLYTLDEDVRDFAEAWSLQEARARGERIPRRCRDPRLLQYREACSLGQQVENLFKTVGRERCHLVVFDDVAARPERVYRDVVAFLDIDPTAPPRFATRNPHREVRSRWLQRFLTNPPPVVAAWAGLWEGRGWGRPRWLRETQRRIKHHNTRKSERLPLSEEMAGVLRAAFANDVDRLSSLLERDLGHWLGANVEERRQAAAGPA
jgi:hypothetical protein